jgi:hypothetical protein
MSIQATSQTIKVNSNYVYFANDSLLSGKIEGESLGGEPK